MSIVNNNKALTIAKRFSKKNGILTYSGTLALESAFRLSGIGKGDKVLFNGLTCYSVLQAILNVNAIPVIIYPLQGVTVSEGEITHCLCKYDIKCFVAIHQYGIKQEVENIKRNHPNLIIIEDASQAWDLVTNDNHCHCYSDYIILSMGKTKPLGLGIGGVILTDKDNINDFFDFRDRKSRYKKGTLIPYMLPLEFEVDIIQLIDKADQIISHQREQAKKYKTMFKECPNIRILYEMEGDSYSWHRFPIFFDSLEEYQIVTMLKDKKIPYQKEFKISLHQLEMAQSAIVIGSIKKEKMILLQTR